jgi:tetratricopeptide (TPR) repeat protein
VADAFAAIQRGDGASALRIATEILRREPSNARAQLAAGIALRLGGELAAARAALERAASLDPRDYGAAYELGMALELSGEHDAALAQYERCATLRPGFLAAHFAGGLQRFRRAQWNAAIEAFGRALAIDPQHVESLVNLGQALAERGSYPQAIAALERALAVDPASAEARHALGWILHKAGQAKDAVAHLEAAAAIQPRNAHWQSDLAKVHADLGRDGQALAIYEGAMTLDPHDTAILVAFGRYCVSREDYARAAELFGAALAAGGTDEDGLPMYAAQTLLLLGRWKEGWSAYRQRAPRRRFETRRAAAGLAYAVPALAEVAGRTIVLLAEQGLGDTLFFLRFAPQLAARGATLAFAGDARLHPLLARTGLFAELRAASAEDENSAGALLIGDLPSLDGMQPLAPSLSIAADPSRVQSWRRTLEAAGPRPWIGVAWRAGTPADSQAHGLYKAVPLEALMRALAPLGGTVVSLQRHPASGEIGAASSALGAPVIDLARANDDLEDGLALVSQLDRQVGVSNTNVHLAAAAGGNGDVLVPFPPEWRWGAAGLSPWFPNFRVHRQGRDGDWSAALAAIAG